MTDDTPSVVCCGITTLDIVQVVDRLPGPDEKFTAASFFDDVGGPAANAAATAQALGAETKLITSVGPEPVGRLAATLLDDAGVHVIDLGGSGATVSTVLVNRNTGHRAVVSTKPQYSNPEVPVGGRELDGAAALLVDGHHMDVALMLAREASARAIPVILDGGSWKPRTEELLPFVDYAAVSAVFRVPTGDEPLQAVAEMGCRFVAQSQGSDSIRLLADGRHHEVSVEKLAPSEIVDTLGAGDVLHGAMAAIVAYHGRSLAFEELMRRAAAVATESCRHRGARGWARLPTVAFDMRAVVAGG